MSLADRQVLIRRPDQADVRIPVEDLGLLVVESCAASLSAALLAALALAGAVVVTCDEARMPVGLHLPLHGHTTHTERVRFQAEAGLPLKKSLWRAIVRAKVRGQAATLVDGAARTRLVRLAAAVRSGDTTNIEAQAAQVYWRALLGADFRRDRDGAPPNGLLNYGYSVLRATVARGICAGGLIPALGLAHRNRYNPLVLADDLMEPYRPCVDRRVLDLRQRGVSEVGAESKPHLLEVLSDPVMIGGSVTRVVTAIERTCSSLATSLEAAGRGAGTAEAVATLLLPDLDRTEEDKKA